MGLLDSIFGGARQSGSGGPSPITLGLLAILAYRTYQGKGRLADMLGRGQQNAEMPGSADRGLTPTANQGGMGGLGDMLGGLLGGRSGASPMGGGMAGGGLGDLLKGGLGGLLGGAAAGSVLSGGLGDLIKRFQDSGQGDTAQSWVGHGENRRIAPQEVENVVGRDVVQELSDHSGRPYDQVLSELSESLPDTVDKLTPEGRLPTEDEASRWV